MSWKDFDWIYMVRKPKLCCNKQNVIVSESQLAFEYHWVKDDVPVVMS